MDDYLHQGWLRFATQRGIEIVSEASRRIPDELRTAHPEIPWPDIAAIGNLLRHGYDSLNDDIIWGVIENIWGVIENDLPPLKLVVANMLRELGPLDSEPN